MKTLISVILFMWSALVFAHKPSDSYLSINVEGNLLTGRWDIALRDLDFAIGLDDNNDGAITWGELRSKQTEISGYVFARLRLGAAELTCGIEQRAFKVDSHTDGSYAVLFFQGDCGVATINQINIHYRLFADLDPQHRGLLKLNSNQQTVAAVLVPNQPVRSFDLAASRITSAQVFDFVREGVWHIWIGFDHILFLFSLLIPSVMVYRNTLWQPVNNFREALWDVVKVVTAFTLAHSLTLSLAVLGYAELPSCWVESVIAASVIIAALNNIMPVITRRRAALAFGFGLVHGFGFASVLADLGLSQSSKLWSLLGFNVGVEIGQIALVLVFLPVSYRLSRYAFYRPLMMKTGSVAIAGVASVWFIERAFAIPINVLWMK